MNTVAEKPVTALTLPERAAVALGTAQHEIKLRELVASSADIVAVIDPAGREQAHRIGMNLKTARVNIEKAGKIAREDATAFSKAIIAEEKRLVAIAEPEEGRVIGLRDTWDAKIEAEKQAKIAAERMRMDAIKARIAALRDFGFDMTHGTARELSNAIVQLDALRPGDGWKDAGREFEQEALTAWGARMEQLKMIRNATHEREAAALAAEQARIAEAARIEAERAELAALRAEAAKVAAEQAAEAKRLADLAATQEAEAKRQRDQAAAEQAERERVAVEAQAKANAELKAAQDKLNAEQAEFRAQQAAAQAAAILAQEIEIHHGLALAMNAEWDAEKLEQAAFDADGHADDIARCTATADAMLKDGRAGIDALTDAADAATIHCQEFHELAMDYRGALAGCGQAEYERLIAYIDTYAASKA